MSAPAWLDWRLNAEVNFVRWRIEVVDAHQGRQPHRVMQTLDYDLVSILDRGPQQSQQADGSLNYLLWLYTALVDLFAHKHGVVAVYLHVERRRFTFRHIGFFCTAWFPGILRCVEPTTMSGKLSEPGGHAGPSAQPTTPWCVPPL